MYIPWQFKIAAKLIISKISVKNRIWKDLGVFRHGKMNEAEYAYRVFLKHYRLVKPNLGFVCLELGPGYSLATSILTILYGGKGSYLVDTDDLAIKKIDYYKKLYNIVTEGKNNDFFNIISPVENMLEKCNSRYMIRGLESLKDIPDNSVDFIFSQAVIEHIWLKDFHETISELRRIIKQNGACSHRIDLKDHFNGRLNNLRVPKALWETSLIRKSGFYTNRLRYREMLNIFESTGFICKVYETNRWDQLPTPRRKMAEEFKNLDSDDLTISGFSVILTPK